MPVLRLVPLLALMGCPRTPVPALKASAEAQVRAYVERWGGGTVLEDVDCPAMAGGFPETKSCTSTLEGETVGWTVTITPVEGARLDSVAVAPAGVVFARALESSAVTHALGLLAPSVSGRLTADCGEPVVRRARPDEPIECVVLEGDRRRVLRGTLTPDLEPAWSGLEDDTL